MFATRMLPLLLLVLTGVAPAVQPTVVVHTSEKDFAGGETDRAVIWSLGEITLGPEATTMVDNLGGVDAVTSLALGADGTAYVGTAVEARVLRVTVAGEAGILADVPAAMVTDLLVDGETIWVAAAGATGGVFKLNAEGPIQEMPEAPAEQEAAAGPASESAAVEPFWSDEEAPNVWALCKVGNVLYAATGPNGKVYAIDTNGDGTVILTVKQKTLRSLACAGGKLYAGTSEKGLVYEVDLAADGHPSRVLLDAEEEEIVALAVDAGGNVLAAGTNVTSDVPSSPADGDGGSPLRDRSAAIDTTLDAADDVDPDQSADEATPEGEDERQEHRGSEADADSSTGPTGQQNGEFADVPARGELIRPTIVAPASVEEALTAEQVRAMATGEGTQDSEPGAKPRKQQTIDLEQVASSAPAQPTTRRSPRPRRGGSVGGQGNTIYRIDAEGFVTSVGAVEATILCMTLVEDEQPRLLIGADGGVVRVIDLATGAAGDLARMDPKKTTALAARPDGRVLVGLTDPVKLATLSAQSAGEGIFTSEPIDAGQIARWGSALIRGRVDGDASITLSLRSGNTSTPEDAEWSDWSGEVEAMNRWTQLDVAPARFAQYRVRLTGREGDDPMVDEVALVHQVDNLAPEIVSVTVEPSARPSASGGNAEDEPMRYRIVTVEADDPNGDTLRYDFYYRQWGRRVWILAEEDSAKPLYAWDATTVPDGLYELRVVARDDSANPPSTALTDERLSRPVVIDSRPPVVAELTARPVGRGAVELSARFTDANRLIGAEYVVNSGEKAVAMAAADGVFDEAEESARVTIGDLEAGDHVITVRVGDEFGNIGYAAVEVSVR